MRSDVKEIKSALEIFIKSGDAHRLKALWDDVKNLEEMGVINFSVFDAPHEYNDAITFSDTLCIGGGKCHLVLDQFRYSESRQRFIMFHSQRFDLAHDFYQRKFKEILKKAGCL